MSVEPVHPENDRKRIAQARANGETLNPSAKVLGWDVRWRQEPGNKRPTSYRYLKADGYTKHDADDLEVRIHRQKRRTGGYAYRSDVISGAQDPSERQTLHDFLLGPFMAFVQSSHRPNTQKHYAIAIDDRILSIKTPHVASTTRHQETEIGMRPVDLITVQALLDWKQSLLDAGIARRQVGKAVEVLRSALSYAVELGLIDRNPALGVRGLAVPRRDRNGGRAQAPISPDRVVDPLNIERLRVHLERRSRTLRNTVIVALIAYLGLRPNEVCVLRWRDLLNPDSTVKRRFRLERGLSNGEEVHGPKGGNPRMVTVFTPVADDILRYYQSIGSPDHETFVAPTIDGRMNNPDAIYEFISRAARKAGLPRFRPYDLRHTAASLLGTCGDESKPGQPWPIQNIAQQLGHSVETCIRIYLHVLENPLYRGTPIEQVIRECRSTALGRSADHQSNSGDSNPV